MDAAPPSVVAGPILCWYGNPRRSCARRERAAGRRSSWRTGIPAGYMRALADASTAAELTDPAGLGGHYWLLQPVGIELPPTMTCVTDDPVTDVS